MFDDIQNSDNLNEVKSINAFTIPAFIFGILSVFALSSIVFSFLLGGLAIIFAILSKGPNLKMERKSFIGFSTSLFSIIASIAIIATTVYMIFFNAEFHEKINQEYKQLYGITLDEYVELIKDISNGDVSEETLNKLPFSGNNPSDMMENYLKNMNGDTKLPDINNSLIDM